MSESGGECEAKRRRGKGEGENTYRNEEEYGGDHGWVRVPFENARVEVTHKPDNDSADSDNRVGTFE